MVRRLIALELILFLGWSKSMIGAKPPDWPAGRIGPGPGYQVVRVQVPTEGDLHFLAALSEMSPQIELWSDFPAVGNIDVRLAAEAVPLLELAGLTFETTIPDLQLHYDELFPQRGGNFFDTFRTYDEHVAFMQDLVAAFPHLARMESLGTSVGGKALWTLRVTGGNGPKPAVMYHGVQHGNEVHGAVVVALLARTLLEQYDSDAYTQELVDGIEFFLMPIMNPDGYMEGSRENLHGVDLNRDWTGPGAPGRFTQPETVAMRDFFVGHPNVRAHVDLHGYRADIMWPWGHTPDFCPDHHTFQVLADRMAEAIERDRGPQFYNRGPIYTTIYPVLGGSVDYAYGIHKIWSFAYELIGVGGPTDLELWAEYVNRGLLELTEFVRDCSTDSLRDLPGSEEMDCNQNHTLDTCEASDFDGDGLYDICDPDVDGDGYLNEVDACIFAPIGGRARTGGYPAADFNSDCRIDHLDYNRWQECLEMGGPGTPTVRRLCRIIDFDTDSDVDLLDLSLVFNDYGP